MSPRPFLFGKLPALGDFVRHGVADAEGEACDAWLSAALPATGQDPAFAALHGAAPAWLFVCADDGAWRAGAVAPSVDAVGRRFLLAAGVADLSPGQAAVSGLAIAQAAEAVLYDALRDRLEPEALVARLAAAADPFVLDALSPLQAQAAQPGAWWTLGGERHPPAALADGWRSAQALALMLAPPAEEDAA